MLKYNGYEGDFQWVSTSIEHDGEDYYLTYDSKIKLDGLLVRIREGENPLWRLL